MTSRVVLLLVVLHLWTSSASAQQTVSLVPPGDESANFETEVLLSGLDNPTGLTVRPTKTNRGPFELFVAESGASRVLRFSTDAPQQTDEVVIDFPLGLLDAQSKHRVGPLGLSFLSRAKLLVGAKGNRVGEDVVLGYTLPSDGTVLDADQEDHSVGPIESNIAAKIDGLQFCGLAMMDQLCFVTSGGQETQGQIFKAGVEANHLSYLQPFIDLQKVTSTGAPAGIAVIPEPRPAFLVVGLMGHRESAKDSRLAYFLPTTGELAMNLPVGLHDIVSLAYSPSGQLYAADFSWHDEQAGGIYRIDDARIEGQQSCRAVKIAAVVRPFCLAFTPDGSLYATAFGNDENAKQGTLVKITGEL